MTGFSLPLKLGQSDGLSLGSLRDVGEYLIPRCHWQRAQEVMQGARGTRSWAYQKRVRPVSR